MRLSEDSHGLRVSIDPPDTSAGRDVVESIRRGDLNGMSFAFHVVDEAWADENGVRIRELRQVHLIDVSVVAFPAYRATAVSLVKHVGSNFNF